jgi:hypothetical protein
MDHTLHEVQVKLYHFPISFGTVSSAVKIALINEEATVIVN